MLNKGCNKSHALQAGMTVIYSAMMQYLASIDVKSEDSILRKETVIRSHCVFKEIDMQGLRRHTGEILLLPAYRE